MTSKFKSLLDPRALFGAALVLLVASVASPAAHAGDPSQLGLELKTLVSGKAKPEIALSPVIHIKRIEITLTAADTGETQRLKAGSIKARQRKALNFKQDSGTTAYTADIEVLWEKGDTDRFKLEFSATRVGELKMQMEVEDVDLGGRKVQARATNPIQSVELKIFGENDKLLWEGDESFDPPVASGENAAIAWDELAGEIIRMDYKLTDVAGFWTGMRISPFSVEIPHEEVVFDSGRSNITDTEAPKLERTMAAIQDALKKHGTLLELKLFVGGYTDTVADKASNRSLSLARAQSIGQWFRHKGLKIPIFYWGFGEEVLAVQTPDETEESRNRRAVYILSTHAPTGRDVPYNSWKRL